jgi:hypothetical protein
MGYSTRNFQLVLCDLLCDILLTPLARSGRKEVKDEKEKTIQKRRQDFYSGNGD